METGILFLGTAGDAIATGSQMRSSGGIILTVGSNQFVIDPGPGTLPMAKQASINLRNTTALLVTHNHLNHANDANAVISAMSHGGMDNHGVLVASQSVLSGYDDVPPFVSHYHRQFVERYTTIEPGQRLAINEVEIRVMPAFHTDPTAVGFKFFTDKFTLGYTGDTEYRKELKEAYKETDIMVLNVKNLEEKQKGSLNLNDAINLIDDTNPKLAILTHFGVKMLAKDPIAHAREVQKATKVQTIAATDGMALHPSSYSAGLRTKTLNLY